MAADKLNKSILISEDNNYDNTIEEDLIINNHLKVNLDTAVSETPMGLSPKEIYDFYNFPRDYRRMGRGKTIALIDAFAYPNAEEDLRKFSTEFSLPMPRFEVLLPQGEPEESGSIWSLEAALDVQWAHAMAPAAKIMLVLAKSSAVDDLYDAVDYAVKRGADIISMSWGSRESRGILELEKYFRNKRTIFVASAGDHGGITEYPSSSKYVISVGGTTLNRNVFGNYVSESAWINSGGGPSRFIDMPIWQKRFGLESMAGIFRATPDVAFDADPYTGVSVYHTNPITQKSSWIVVGGTSLAAPSWAGIIASVFTGYRTTSQVINELYNLAGRTRYINAEGCFHDITTGSAGSYKADYGYDFITGLGAPDIDIIRRNVLKDRRRII